VIVNRFLVQGGFISLGEEGNPIGFTCREIDIHLLTKIFFNKKKRDPVK